MASAAAEVGVEPVFLRRVAQDLTASNGFFLEGVVNYDQVARQASRARVMFSDENYKSVSTGLAPGVTELLGELLDQPAILPITGWGAAARIEPAPTLPRMTFSVSGHWEEQLPVSRSAE